MRTRDRRKCVQPPGAHIEQGGRAECERTLGTVFFLLTLAQQQQARNTGWTAATSRPLPEPAFLPEHVRAAAELTLNSHYAETTSHDIKRGQQFTSGTMIKTCDSQARATALKSRGGSKGVEL